MFKVQPNPTFKADVTFAVPGGDEGKIKFIFKHKGRKALKTFFEDLGNTEKTRTDHEALLEIVEGWEGVDQKFSPDVLELVLDNYPAAGIAIFETYNRSIFEAKQKN